MDWKNQLTKTPYLVLFVVLISIGVGTASAAITITLAGNVHVLGDMVIDETLLIGTDNPNDDDGIRFDDGSEVLFWDESENSFQVTDDLVTEGDLRTTGDLRVGTIDAEDNDKIFFDDGTETLMWQNTNSQFELSDGLLANGDLITTTDVEAETFVLGPSNSGDNDFIFFDFISEHLVWDDIGNRFEFSNDLGIGTDLGTDDDSLYFDSGTDESLTWKNNDNRFELSNDLFVDGEQLHGNEPSLKTGDFLSVRLTISVNDSQRGAYISINILDQTTSPVVSCPIKENESELLCVTPGKTVLTIPFWL